MQEEWMVFIKCFDAQTASDTESILAEGGLNVKIQDNTANTFEKVYFGVAPQDAFWIMIPAIDEEKAQALLDAAMRKVAAQWEGFHEFKDYSIEELLEIVRNKKEWGAFEYAMAKRILEEKLMG